MELNNGISLLVECEDCKQRFEISSNKIIGRVNRKTFIVNGKSILLTYYDCPSCGRRHYVQIDDAVSLEILRNVKAIFARLSVAKRKGKEITKAQSVEFKEARKHLSDYRMKLMKEYTGKSIYNDETDSKFVLRFSV